ncbi:MAG TPA: hypothetical protein VKA13_06760 [Gammaproteobacteria bacterium]|nr:hypothetical protein [Gammaproteobacteria bacterium]
MANPIMAFMVRRLHLGSTAARAGLAGLAAVCSFVVLFGFIATHMTVYASAPAGDRGAGAIAAKWSSSPPDPFTAFQRGRFGEAFHGFNKLVAAGKDTYRVRYYRGLTQELFHRYGDALTDMLAAIRHNPDLIQAYKHANWLYARQQRWPKIIALWDGYLARHPHDGEAYLAQAGAYRRAGDMASSRADLDKACQYGADLACAILYPLS